MVFMAIVSERYHAYNDGYRGHDETGEERILEGEALMVGQIQVGQSDEEKS
jgi:hypothetical protein